MTKVMMLYSSTRYQTYLISEAWYSMGNRISVASIQHNTQKCQQYSFCYCTMSVPQKRKDIRLRWYFYSDNNRRYILSFRQKSVRKRKQSNRIAMPSSPCTALVDTTAHCLLYFNVMKMQSVSYCTQRSCESRELFFLPYWGTTAFCVAATRISFKEPQ